MLQVILGVIRCISHFQKPCASKTAGLRVKDTSRSLCYPVLCGHCLPSRQAECQAPGLLIFWSFSVLCQFPRWSHTLAWKMQFVKKSISTLPPLPPSTHSCASTPRSHLGQGHGRLKQKAWTKGVIYFNAELCTRSNISYRWAPGGNTCWMPVLDCCDTCISRYHRISVCPPVKYWGICVTEHACIPSSPRTTPSPTTELVSVTYLGRALAFSAVLTYGFFIKSPF